MGEARTYMLLAFVARYRLALFLVSRPPDTRAEPVCGRLSASCRRHGPIDESDDAAGSSRNAAIAGARACFAYHAVALAPLSLRVGRARH